MAVGKEIRGKIRSVENTKKITRAMQMVAASKMRKAQDRMRAARPYSDKVRRIAAHLSHANPEYRPPFLTRPGEPVNRVGFILVTTDKGLCGGMNTNILRDVAHKTQEFESQGKSVEFVAIGTKGAAFLRRARSKVLAQAVQLGDAPRLDALLGPVKALLDEYADGRLDAVYLCYTRFLTTMKQEATIEQLLPLGEGRFAPSAEEEALGDWDYIYEPDAKTVIDDLLQRYTEALIYQSVAENMASEQSARMVAMKAASDNAGHVIHELSLAYNKSRQAAITTEISEIVAGAAAV